MVGEGCAFCGGVISYEPYSETIQGNKLAFHSKACAEALKQEEKKCAYCWGIVAYEPYY